MGSGSICITQEGQSTNPTPDCLPLSQSQAVFPYSVSPEGAPNVQCLLWSSFNIVRAVHFPNIPAVGLVCEIVQIYWQTICAAPICPLFLFYGALESVEKNIKCKYYSIFFFFFCLRKNMCVYVNVCLSIYCLFVTSVFLCHSECWRYDSEGSSLIFFQSSIKKFFHCLYGIFAFFVLTVCLLLASVPFFYQLCSKI